ncbi:efflux RND transporter permease subunit [Shewanella schlegeliana]|uniref:Efflux pump membrane transporter n=1 Tax=Shewanella schlegeliana TaxID=190308 RepID=A0ABS1T2F4_9GAMM|nr:efflux RND transporter permease subunit [Shewanella schlegeliana]MBL4914314.1 efflux RND transporter permease subunit [Shewanella schlegeliana]MCL1109463.1 efflux RND transporter permease subunit [Shewanella schlegeliana]GIU37343.1 transporter [Shewanella schlegeliana]
MSRFFINRPNFAIVIALFMSIIGGIAIALLPVGQYPNVAPPTVMVYVNMDGGSTDVMQKSVASIIEKEVNGVEGMTYMKSNIGNDGSYSLEVSFEIGIDADRAVTLVQNRVNKSISRLPEGARRYGVTVEKVSSGMLMAFSVRDNTEKMDSIELSNWTSVALKEGLQRISGVSRVMVIGEKNYSMRVWLDPSKMSALALTVEDVQAALLEQNQILAAGRAGTEPSAGIHSWEYTFKVDSALASAEQFSEVIVRSDQFGLVKVKDIARTELGSVQYLANTYHNNQAASTVFMYRTPTSNAMEVGSAVKNYLNTVKLPTGIEIEIPYDGTVFVQAAIDDIFNTLRDAVILVVLITLLFLQSWRVTLITAAAIPVSLISTFAVMLAAGMTINIISMFGLILAIGIVVDAAIIVIENVERLLEEDESLSIKQAVLQTMQEVTGAIIASMLVLLSVFGPTLFMPGMTGILYGQFGIAISAAVVISTIVALVLTPVMCVLLMKRGESKKIWLFRVFNKGVDHTRNGFGFTVNFLSRRLGLAVLLFTGMLGSIYLLGENTSTGFLPEEDKGTLFAVVMLPDGSALHRTDAALHQLSEKAQQIKGVKTVLSASGFNLITNTTGSNAGLLLISLDDLEERKSDETVSQWAILEQVQAVINSNDEVYGFAFAPPAIPELGLVSGFDLMFKDKFARDPSELADAANTFINKINEDPRVVGAYTTFNANTPNVVLDIDREQIKMQGLRMDQVFNTIQAQFAGAFAGEFNHEGRNFYVFVQAEQVSRKNIDDLNYLTVRNDNGDLINISSLVTPRVEFGPQVIQQFNLMQAVNINGYPAQGYASGDAIAAVEEAAQDLPEGFEIEWSGLTKQELAAGDSAVIAFMLAILFTYLLLVAQYESWVIALCIILSVPTALLGTLFTVFAMGSDINIYVQIAMVLLVGMAAKNAILIVEFAKNLREEKGYDIVEAAVTATKMRFRAVMMTAMSFVLGLVPLMFSDGAGYAAQQSIGWAACGGMISATFIGLLIVPVIYVMLQTLREKCVNVPLAPTKDPIPN